MEVSCEAKELFGLIVGPHVSTGDQSGELNVHDVRVYSANLFPSNISYSQKTENTSKRVYTFFGGNFAVSIKCIMRCSSKCFMETRLLRVQNQQAAIMMEVKDKWSRKKQKVHVRDSQVVRLWGFHHQPQVEPKVHGECFKEEVLVLLF